jgi:hypothetical protein
VTYDKSFMGFKMNLKSTYFKIVINLQRLTHVYILLFSCRILKVLFTFQNKYFSDFIAKCLEMVVIIIIGTVAAVEISDRKDLNTLYKFRNLISVNRIFIKDYKVSVSI